ncbi:MAG: histidine kinase, partial [Cyanobacteria bacterium P01_F01_bin.42]
LEQENEALRDQLGFKDRMITILAHDLRNPLTAAAIAVETLKGQWSTNKAPKQTLPPELLLKLINQAQAQIHNIDRMITNLLEASRGRSEDLKIQPKCLQLQTLCDEVLGDIRASLKQKSLELSTDIPNDIPEVHADPDQIRQVLMNLFDNAMKYTDIGGKIKLTILHRTTQKVQVCICDDGLGIPLEKQATIFEDSVRLKRDEQKDGYGIGLALCRRIVRAHYGQIWVDSKPNEGSCFNFTLPVFH